MISVPGEMDPGLLARRGRHVDIGQIGHDNGNTHLYPFLKHCVFVPETLLTIESTCSRLDRVLIVVQ